MALAAETCLHRPQVYRKPIKRDSGKRSESTQENVLMGGASRSWYFSKQILNLLRENVWRAPAETCVRFFRFLFFTTKLRHSGGRPQCVLPTFAETCSSCSSIPSHNLRRHRSPSRHPARSCVFFVTCVMSIYRSICLCICLPHLVQHAGGVVCYAPAIVLAATS